MDAKEKYYNIIIDRLIKETDFHIKESIDGLYVEVAFPMDGHYTTYDIQDLTTIPFDVDGYDYTYLQELYGINTEKEADNTLKEYWVRITKNILGEMKQAHPNDPEIKCLV